MIPQGGGCEVHSSGSNAEVVRRDLRVVWHPCTQMHDHESVLPLVPIRRGRGVWLEDYEGKRYLDAISSWWVNLFGHAHPRINAALKAQVDELEHVIFAGFTHEAGVQLAERLVAITPEGLTRCFFADNGSAAVEVALKMSFQFWHNHGASRRTRFVNLANSYHGETLGALAVGDVALYKSTYTPLLMQAITTPSPDAYAGQSDETPAAVARRQAAALDRLLAAQGDTICAVIIEPLVQCAGSMRMYDPLYLSLARAACDRHNVHLIADEIAVGFGRTGTLFACEQGPIKPDFMCLSKGLTGGYLPLAAVLTTEPIYQSFYDDYSTLRAFLHSHSYTGNPLACSVALATLDVFATTPVLERNKVLAERLAYWAETFRTHHHVGDVRQRGMILAVEMVRDRSQKTPYPWQERRGLIVYRHALSRGVLLRPLGNVVYFMPPYVITPAEIDLMCEVALEGIELATRDS